MNERNEDIKSDIKLILKEKFNMKDVTIGRIHRTPSLADQNNPNPRIVHAKFLNWADREEIIKKAPKALRQTLLFFPDDIDPCTKKEEQLLKVKMREIRDDGRIAFIPFTIPRVLKYRDATGPGPLKT